MQDTVSQARKNGMISTDIDLFLAALPVVLMAIDFVFEGIPGYPYNIVIIGGIFIALICFSVIYRLRALRKISKLSGIKAAALYRNCVIVFICISVFSLFHPISSCREEMVRETTGETIWNLAVPAAAIYIIVAWLCINFSLARVSGVSTLSHLRVALRLLFRAKLAMWRRTLRFGYLQAANWRFRCGFSRHII